MKLPEKPGKLRLRRKEVMLLGNISRWDLEKLEQKKELQPFRFRTNGRKYYITEEVWQKVVLPQLTPEQRRMLK